MNKCAICGETKAYFTIELIEDDICGYTRAICDSCWDIIAEVAYRRMKDRIKQIEILGRELDRIERTLDAHIKSQYNPHTF